MTIAHLSIENFKGIGIKQKVDLAPVTLLFGPNSAGKSTILHALNYLNDIVCHLDAGSESTRLGEQALDLGGFRQFVHRHELDRTVSLGAEIDLGDVDLFEARANRAYRLQYELASPAQREASGLIDLATVTRNINQIAVDVKVAWSDLSQGPYVQRVEIGFEGTRFATIVASSDGRRNNIEFLKFDHPALVRADGQDWVDLASASIASRHYQSDGHALIGIENARQAIPDWREPLELSDVWDIEDRGNADRRSANGPLIITALLECLIRGSLETLAGELGGLRYLGPLRELPERTYRPNRVDGANWATGLGAWDVLYRNGPLLDEVNEWLSESHLKTGYRIEATEVLELGWESPFIGWLQAASIDANRDAIQKALEGMVKRKQLVLRDVARDVAVQPNDVGVGISQMLPVIVGALADDVRVYSIEQPEIHIHPRLQVGLGDLFIHAAKTQNKVFLIETHSEHLILRLLRRIRETAEATNHPDDFTAEDIKVLYVECVDGETRVSPLRISDTGRFIDRWPDGFFDERYGELDE